MSLEDWLNEGYLKRHKSSHKEIGQLVDVYRRDIADARVKGLSVERQFESAYNAGLVMAKAALAASGYRTSGEGNHYRTIQSLAFTLQIKTDIIDIFNKFRNKRNISNYEKSGIVSLKEVREMILMAENLHTRVISWLEDNYSDLLEK